LFTSEAVLNLNASLLRSSSRYDSVKARSKPEGSVTPIWSSAAMSCERLVFGSVALIANCPGSVRVMSTCRLEPI
jgi:hypothetical protein